MWSNILRLSNERLFSLVVVVYPMKGAVTRAAVRIGMVPNLTNVLKEHRFGADAYLDAFEQLEVISYQGSCESCPI